MPPVYDYGRCQLQHHLCLLELCLELVPLLRGSMEPLLRLREPLRERKRRCGGGDILEACVGLLLRAGREQEVSGYLGTANCGGGTIVPR